jgi:predicted dehydrogenase
MPTPLRFGVVGAGAIGVHHLEAIRRCPRAQLVALAEISPQRRAEAAAKFQIPQTFADYRQMLRAVELDAVSIALPNYLHAPVALAALQAGKHVHLDKPFAMNLREAERVVAAARKHKRVFMVGQNQRFSREAQTLKLCIEKGLLGDIYHGRAWWIRRAGIPRIGSWFTQQKYAGGGCVLDIGVHMLDLCLHLMGNFQPETVTGITHQRFGKRGLGNGGWGKSEIDPRLPFDVDDYAAAFIKLKGGASVILEVAWACYDANPNHGVQVYGTEGGGSVFPAKYTRRATNVDGYEVVSPQEVKVPYPEERLHHFVDCVLDGKPPLVLPAQSLAVQRILDAIYRSAATGREVRLK